MGPAGHWLADDLREPVQGRSRIVPRLIARDTTDSQMFNRPPRLENEDLRSLPTHAVYSAEAIVRGGPDVSKIVLIIMMRKPATSRDGYLTIFDPPAENDRKSTMRQNSKDQEHPDPEQRDQETLDRELDELIAEIRVVIPGVTVLFAFLLGLPFTTVFSDLVSLQADVYFVAFISTAMAVIFLISGSAYHQMRGKPYSKGRLIKTAGRQMVTALVLLCIALGAVVFLVTDLLFGTVLSILVTSGITILIVCLWFALPLYRRIRNDR